MNHDDVIKWKHFPRYWPFVRGIHRSLVNSPHKGQWRGALMFTLICVRVNGCVNNREAGDLRRYCAHYGVTIMTYNRFGDDPIARQPIHESANVLRSSLIEIWTIMPCMLCKGTWNYRIIFLKMSYAWAKWWAHLWPKSEKRGTLTLGFYTELVHGLEYLARGVIPHAAPLRVVTVKTHMVKWMSLCTTQDMKKCWATPNIIIQSLNTVTWEYLGGASPGSPTSPQNTHI